MTQIMSNILSDSYGCLEGQTTNEKGQLLAFVDRSHTQPLKDRNSLFTKERKGKERHTSVFSYQNWPMRQMIQP
jgi:hypothetical protein